MALALADACLLGAGTFVGRRAGDVDCDPYFDAENLEATVHRRVHLFGMVSTVADRIHSAVVATFDLG